MMTNFVVSSAQGMRQVWWSWRILGMNPPAPHQMHRLVGYYCYSTIVNLLFSVLHPLHLAAPLLYLNEFQAIIDNLYVSVEFAFSSFKQAVIFVNINSHLLNPAKRHLDRLDERAAGRLVERELLEEGVRRSQRLFWIYVVAFMLSYAAFLVPSLVRHVLMFDVWMPFDWQASQQAYTLAVSFQMFGTLYQVLQNLSNDAYTCTYLITMIAQFRALNKRIETIGSENRQNPDYNRRELIACIEDHKCLMSYFECVRPVIASTIALQFLITGIILCITAMSLVNSAQDFADICRCVMYITVEMGEILPCCWYANSLTEVAESLTTAIYSCRWYEQDAKFRHTLIIFMQRSQKFEQILAAGLVPVTLQSFVSIVRFSFSMFTLLSNI